MLRLVKPLSQMRPTAILLAGDFLLDSYTFGHAERISPEAPVPVIHVEREEHRPGGAGNVALNLAALGARVKTLGRIGCDEAGHELKQILSNSGVDVEGLLRDPESPTPLKKRIIASNQQVVRLDYEEVRLLSEAAEEALIERIPELLQQVELVAVSDYRKGFLTKTLLKALFEAAERRSIPVVTDPKGRDFSKYFGTTLIKPNLSEAYAASGFDQEAPLGRVAEKLFEQTGARSLLITRSEKGLSLFFPDGSRRDFPVAPREIKDVTGAGDTVLATLACGWASGLSLDQAAELANCAAGICIERFGCARITLQDLAERLLLEDCENKIFDDNHLYALKQALKNRPCAIVSVSSREPPGEPLFRLLRRYGENRKRDLLLYVRDEDPEPEFVHFLSQHKAVRFILVDSKSLPELSDSIRTKELFSLENGRIKQITPIGNIYV